MTHLIEEAEVENTEFENDGCGSYCYDNCADNCTNLFESFK
jgi:hypothetical protein